jgi:hypothetical protein
MTRKTITINDALNLLGHKCNDRVTGYTGVATSIAFDLYGCIQVILVPAADEKGKVTPGYWFDFNRLEIIEGKPVMESPEFIRGVKESGPANKPKFSSQPNKA